MTSAYDFNSCKQHVRIPEGSLSFNLVKYEHKGFPLGYYLIRSNKVVDSLHVSNLRK